MDVKCSDCGSDARKVTVTLPPPNTPGVHMLKQVALIDCPRCGHVDVDRRQAEAGKVSR